jgi:hypothetical protein
MAFPAILSSSANDFCTNVDGLLTLSNADRSSKENRSYVQLHRNGIVEAVTSSFLMGDGTSKNKYRLNSLRTEAAIVKYSYTYLTSLDRIGCVPPFAVLVSLIGMNGVPYCFAQGNSIFEDEAGLLNRDQFHFSDRASDRDTAPQESLTAASTVLLKIGPLEASGKRSQRYEARGEDGSSRGVILCPSGT